MKQQEFKEFKEYFLGKQFRSSLKKVFNIPYIPSTQSKEYLTCTHFSVCTELLYSALCSFYLSKKHLETFFVTKAYESTLWGCGRRGDLISSLGNLLTLCLVTWSSKLLNKQTGKHIDIVLLYSNTLIQIYQLSQYSFSVSESNSGSQLILVVFS